MEQWQGFNEGKWERSVDVRDFIQKNYTPYSEDSSEDFFPLFTYTKQSGAGSRA